MTAKNNFLYVSWHTHLPRFHGKRPASCTASFWIKGWTSDHVNLNVKLKDFKYDWLVDRIASVAREY